MEQWLRQLVERQEELERGVFSHPVSTWEEYQRRLGQWMELELMIRKIKGDEEERQRKESES